MYYHLQFENGSNPYICFNNEKFLEWFRNWNIETIKPGFYLVTTPRTKKDYSTLKEAARSLAVDFSLTFSEVSLYQSELIDLCALFEALGRRYGLLTEFRENAIC